MPDEVMEFLNSKPERPYKFAAILADKTRQLLALDRYERRALSRRCSAREARAKKLLTREVSFLRFRFFGGWGFSCAVFRIGPTGEICFCFFQCGLPGGAGGRAPGLRSRPQHRSSVWSS